MQRNLAEGRPLLEGYDGRYRAFTNMEYVAGREWFEGFRHYGGCGPTTRRGGSS